MQQTISALMDGELDEGASRRAIDALAGDETALATWRVYHRIGDAMRDSAVLSAGFAARVGERLAAEPALLAPAALRREPRRRIALSLAASAAAVALVGWLAFAPQPQTPAPLAQAPAAVTATAPTTVPLPSATSDYLFAHQGFSPRVSFQGMAPYVRTVSDEAREARK